MTITYNYLRFPLSSSLPALIYSDSFSSPTNIKNTDETQEYLVFIFSRYAQKQFCGGIGAFPFGSGFPPTSPRRAVGFPLQSLTWVKGASPFGFIFRNTGCFPHSVRSRPLRQAAW